MTRKRAQLPVLGSPAQSPGAAVARAKAAGRNTVSVGFVTLGCDKNTVDSERLLARMLGAGASLSADPADADVVVVNTCGFIESAKEESIEAILDAAKLKQHGRVRAVVATGCLVQRYRDELTAEMPEVDLFLGLTDADRLVPELRRRGLLDERDIPTMERPLRVLTSSTPHTSYLKISEGCDHTCAFCAIPLMRGKFRSTPADVLIAEAQELERQGVVELNIVSQDTTWYGRDVARGRVLEAGEYFVGEMQLPAASSQLPDTAVARRSRIGREAGSRKLEAGSQPASLAALLNRLLRETSVDWYRLFYMYPSGITRELVELMASEPRLLPYLDMPIQHGSDRMLKAMRRPERQATIRERVGWLRASIPDLSLRTTLIVGFPGETDDDFEEMLALLEEVRFDRVEADGTIVARTQAQSLEVDGVTVIPASTSGSRQAEAGSFVSVRIVDALEDDLIAELSA